MKTSARICSILFLFVTFFNTSLYAQAVQPTQTTELTDSAKAADEWLKSIDQGKYDESWDKGSMTLKMTIPKTHWTSLMEHIRKPLGSVTTRKLLDQRPAKNPANLPSGNYMVVFFETSFAQKAKTHELVTLIQETDGKWRPLTYQVQ